MQRRTRGHRPDRAVAAAHVPKARYEIHLCRQCSFMFHTKCGDEGRTCGACIVEAKRAIGSNGVILRTCRHCRGTFHDDYRRTPLCFGCRRTRQLEKLVPIRDLPPAKRRMAERVERRTGRPLETKTYDWARSGKRSSPFPLQGGAPGLGKKR